MIALDISVSSPDVDDECPFLRHDMTSWERGEIRRLWAEVLRCNVIVARQLQAVSTTLLADAIARMDGGNVQSPDSADVAFHAAKLDWNLGRLSARLDGYVHRKAIERIRLEQFDMTLKVTS